MNTSTTLRQDERRCTVFLPSVTTHWPTRSDEQTVSLMFTRLFTLGNTVVDVVLTTTLMRAGTSTLCNGQLDFKREVGLIAHNNSTAPCPIMGSLVPRPLSPRAASLHCSLVPRSPPPPKGWLLSVLQ